MVGDTAAEFGREASRAEGILHSVANGRLTLPRGAGVAQTEVVTMEGEIEKKTVNCVNCV